MTKVPTTTRVGGLIEGLWAGLSSVLLGFVSRFRFEEGSSGGPFVDPRRINNEHFSHRKNCEISNQILVQYLAAPQEKNYFLTGPGNWLNGGFEGGLRQVGGVSRGA